MWLYLRLLLLTLASVPLVLLLVLTVDRPLAGLLHQHGAPLRPFFAGLMRVHDVATTPLMTPWLWLVCLGRVVLEFHWLSDVVAGAALGLLLTCLWELATGWLPEAV
ncbi:phosphatase PAP2 family protein [Hymenobacter metallilatus]|uniref:Phosphatase PAP2 family protein n=1 Tax=Hymenobacter metallilatus TaxID=2493666 RepID=A0A428JRF3_9BACT|nr:phosphatase PAP2 family protein [Hymenobacter metallilatus]RSK36179.1 phosphatase PAP2 family protein [Hymenobacter metallilatus]